MSRPPKALSAKADSGSPNEGATKRGPGDAARPNAVGRGAKPSLAAIVAAATPPARKTAEIVRLDVSATARARPSATLKQRARQMSVYLEPPVYDQLRDMAHTERTKMHALMLEALDLLFKQRGARSIAQVTESDTR